MTVLFSDPLFLRHETGRHPERPERLQAVTERLHQSGLAARCVPGSFAPLPLEAVEAVHTQGLAQYVRELADEGGGRVDPDTVVSPASCDVALGAAGACCAAVDAVMNGPEKTALCLVRPPGHHATRRTSMGFCLFNNIALAARHAQKKYGLNRILIVDWDVHHGNGTQDIFYDDGQVTFLSIHRYGMGFYPGTGAGNEAGTGAGLGHTFNAPIRYGTSRADYRSTYTRFLEEVADRSRPELVLVSAGFDAHALDPIGSLGLEVEDFQDMTQQVREVARTHANGRLVSCLEGGYHLEALSACVLAHLDELLIPDER